MVFVRMLSKLLRDKDLGDLVVPIVPDEARTFGMEALFRQVGIYSHVGQLYEPVDIDNLLYYKEATDGQIFEEGITEAGSLASFIAAGTAYATHGVNTIPFFIFYSMFGLQRVGDLIWAAGDMRCRGFILGGTAGRTTLAGEGLQHQDGNSHLLALPVPNLLSYDPAFAYEIATIIDDGIRRMYGKGESIFYYLTVMNEQYAQPAMPAGAREGILKGLYKLQAASAPKSKLKAQLLGSGAILPEVLKAQALLAEKYHVAAEVWSVTSYTELYRDGNACDRWNMLHPTETPRLPWVSTHLNDTKGVIVAASDYVKALPCAIDRWVSRPIHVLGTDGFGRSEGRLGPPHVLRGRPPLHHASPRCRPWRARSRSTPRSSTRPFAISASTPRRPIRRSADRRRCPRTPDNHVRRTAQAIRIVPTEFALPPLGENVAGGDVLKVLVTPGDMVDTDQPVLELETDKATIEVPSGVAGRVIDVRVREGETIKVGEVVFTVEDGAGVAAAAPPSEAESAATPVAPVADGADEAAPVVESATPAAGGLAQPSMVEFALPRSERALRAATCCG